MKRTWNVTRHLAVLGVSALSILPVSPAVSAQSTLTRWSFTLQGAARIPQDIWISALGSNLNGWQSGGSICLGPLAQGIDVGQSATILTSVLSAGILGVDGQPVPATDAAGNPLVYFAPGIEIPGRRFSLENGRSFFVIIDGFIVESTTDAFSAGSHLPIMFTFDFVEGRVEQELVAWTLDANGKWFPLLNEGLMMTNVRRVL